MHKDIVVDIVDEDTEGVVADHMCLPASQCKGVLPYRRLKSLMC